VDFDYQTSWKADDRNEILWGAGARYISDNLQGHNTFAIPRPIDNETTLNAFLQDQIALLPKEVYLTLGSKFEENSLIGFVPEPNARIAWYPDNKQTLWAAVSRAVTTPEILDESAIFNVETIAPGVIAQEQSSRNLDSEELIAYEIGYRIRPVQAVSLDSAAFINEYDKLITFEPGNPISAPAGAYIPFVVSNLGRGHTYGFEESATWDVSSSWSLLANYTYLNMILNQGSSQDPTFLPQEGESPHNQFTIRSRLFLPYDVQMVNQVYYVDKLPAYSIDEYLRFDTQFIWKAENWLEFSFVGQNLLDSKHDEFAAPPSGIQDEIPRSFYAKVTVRY
jgi:iron complex outermembrane receptor protein